MELELHVGPLTAFFAPAVRADAAHHGEPPPGDDEVRDRVVAWRDWLGAGLVANGHVQSPPTWDETAAAPVVRVRVPLDAVRALKLAIAYGSVAKAPPHLPTHPDADPRWSALAAEDFASTPFDHVMVPELWLPGAFDFTFRCPLPDGHEVQAGAVVTLASQLARVAEEVLDATPLDVALWATTPPDGADRRVRSHARFGFAQLQAAADAAAAQAAPILWTAATPRTAVD